jgi:hypothetical protein
MPETLEAFAGNRPDGSIVYEELLVEPLGSGRYRLLQSPGLVLGVAAADIFELTDARRVKVLERGGNLCIQIYCSPPTPQLERELTQRMQRLRGRLDGRSNRQLVYTVPASVGFPSVEEALDAIVKAFPTVEWFFGNVYDPNDGVTPLNWW